MTSARRRPRRNRPPARTPGTERESADVPVTRFSNPADIITTVPYLLGFTPSESLVAVELRGPRKRFGPILRYDIVTDGEAHDAVLPHVLAVARRDGWRRVLVIAFTADPESCGEAALALVQAFEAMGVEVEDAFCTTGERWWCYTCTDERCCPASGRQLDASTTHGAAEAVLAGLTAAPSREALRERFEPAGDAERSEVARCVATLRRRWSRLGRTPDADGLVRLVRAHRSRVGELTGFDHAMLALAVQDVVVRDEAIAQITRAGAAVDSELWLDVLRHAPDDLAPAVACVVGFSFWLDGRGVLASMAVEHALDRDPAYRLALLLGEMLAQSVNPARWTPGAVPGDEPGDELGDASDDDLDDHSDDAAVWAEPDQPA